jgi:hypothetical protein
MLLINYIFFDFNIYRSIDILRLNKGILLFLFFFLHRLIIETLWQDHLLLHLMILSLT